MSANPFSESTSVGPSHFDLFGRLRRRVVASIAATVGWMSLTLLYVAFWAHGFSLFQSVIVVFVSFLVLCAFLVCAWISFGLGFARRWYH